ncbi:MAG TPA: hypothetical protein VHX36_06265 [Candidatus Acidoferrales bacterium]|nr:hypothetical protein [Candidatus Acidoferrales bacterium]
MTETQAHHDDPSEAANSLAGQSSAITLRPGPELAADPSTLDGAIVFLGEQAIEPRPADVPEKPAPRHRPRRRPAHRARRKSLRAIAIARQTESETPLERHERKCVVCHHPEREAIEEFFVRWQQPHRMAQEYGLPVRSLYRHAHATGLFAARRRNLRSVLEYILEDASVTPATADCIVRAVRAYTCLTDDNRWIEPATHVIVSPASPVPPGAQIESTLRRLENDASC